jgi:hypothetical protein
MLRHQKQCRVRLTRWVGGCWFLGVRWKKNRVEEVLVSTRWWCHTHIRTRVHGLGCERAMSHITVRCIKKFSPWFGECLFVCICTYEKFDYSSQYMSEIWRVTLWCSIRPIIMYAHTLKHTHIQHSWALTTHIHTCLSKRKFIWALRPKERVQVFTAGNVLYSLAWSTTRVYQHQWT